MMIDAINCLKLHFNVSYKFLICAIINCKIGRCNFAGLGVGRRFVHNFGVYLTT